MQGPVDQGRNLRQDDRALRLGNLEAAQREGRGWGQEVKWVSNLHFVFCILRFVFPIFLFFISYFPFCVLYFAFCILHFAFCILYFAFCILNFGFWILNFTFCILRDTESSQVSVNQAPLTFLKVHLIPYVPKMGWIFHIAGGTELLLCLILLPLAPFSSDHPSIPRWQKLLYDRLSFKVLKKSAVKGGLNLRGLLSIT